MPDLRSRFAGAMLGTFAGDALGMPVENWSGDRIRSTFGLLDEMKPAALWLQVYGKTYGLLRDPGHGLGGARLKRGVYTDDTEMTIGAAESLVACGGFDPAHMARRFAEGCDPRRGYGPGTLQVLRRIRRGEDWRAPAREMFGGAGSYGNGAAMRVAPLALLYHDDPSALREAAERQAEITHTHPVGKEAAVMQAFAIALALTKGASLDARAFCGELRALLHSDCDALLRKLTLMEQLLDRRPGWGEVADTLGNDVSGADSVPAAIYSVIAHPGSVRDAVVFAVNLGGDTDTLGAMAGAVAGALHGVEAIPESWKCALENGRRGRSHVLGLAERLYELHAMQQK